MDYKGPHLARELVLHLVKPASPCNGRPIVPLVMVNTCPRVTDCLSHGQLRTTVDSLLVLPIGILLRKFLQQPLMSKVLILIG